MTSDSAAPGCVGIISLAEGMLAPDVSTVFQALESNGGMVRFVGGAVREVVRDPKGTSASEDIDLATDLTPDHVTRAMEGAGLKAVPTGINHGTITAVGNGRSFEITTLRRDVSTDGRRATVAFTTDWREDAARRDFTMNALSLDRDGALYDFFDGVGDARAGRVRFVGDPARRIREDVLRIVRYYRFLAVLGAKQLDKDALAACANASELLVNLSAERVWREVRKLLAAPNAAGALELMREAGCLDHWLPEATNAAFAPSLGRFVAADPVARLGLASGLAMTGARGDAAVIADRLKLSNAERARLMMFTDPPLRPKQDALSLAQALFDLGRDNAKDVAAVGIALDAGAWAPIAAAAEAWHDPEFPLRGADVVAAGVAQGPAIRDLLDRVRTWWLARNATPKRAACLDHLQRLLSE